MLEHTVRAVQSATPERRRDEVPAPAQTGRPLEADVSRRMGAAFAFDFSRVRIYSERVPGAAAFTVGNSITFAPGRYAPERPDGAFLLAHELAHVVQQRDAAVPNAPGRSRLPQSTRAQEREASGAAVRAAAGRPTGPLSSSREPFVGRFGLDDVIAVAGGAPATAAYVAIGDSTAFKFGKEMTGGFIEGVKQHLADGSSDALKARVHEFETSPSAMYAYFKGYLIGLVEGLISPITDIWNLIKSVAGMLSTIQGWIDRAAALFAQPAVLAARIDALKTRWNELLAEAAPRIIKFIENPSGSAADLADFVQNLTEQALAKAREFGHTAADKVFTFLALPWRELGEKVGYVIGMAVVQTLMLVFSDAIGNALEAAVAFAGKFAGIIAEGAETALRFVAGLGQKLETLFSEAGSMLSETFGALWTKLKAFFESLTAFCEDAAKMVKTPAANDALKGTEKGVDAAKDVKAAAKVHDPAPTPHPKPTDPGPAPHGAQDVRVDKMPDHPFVQLALDFPAVEVAEDVGVKAATRFANDPALMQLYQNGGRDMTTAGNAFHNIAMREARAIPASALPPGWSMTAEESFTAGGMRGRADIMLRGPNGEMVEIDWKTTAESALDGTKGVDRRAGIIQRATGSAGRHLQISRHWTELVDDALAKLGRKGVRR